VDALCSVRSERGINNKIIMENMKLYFWLCFLKGLLDDLFYNFGDIGDSTVLIIRVCQYMKQEIKFRTYTYPHHSRHGLNDVPS